MTKIIANPTLPLSPFVFAELDWLEKILQIRTVLSNSELAGNTDQVYLQEPPPVVGESYYEQTIRRFELGFTERLVLILALAPNLRPDLLDTFGKAETIAAQFGGVFGKNYRSFIPTAETALFILAGSDINKRIRVMKLFDGEHPFAKENLVHLFPVEAGEPRSSGILSVTQDFMDQLIHGKKTAPAFGHNFPAKRIQTDLEWDDLVLSAQTISQLNELKLWLRHSPTLRENISLGKRMKPGYKALFHGPPGTGKTLAANLLGKEMGRDVYRIDLSQIVSKYIGETEKNLAKVFDKAEHSEWILFFDEADALFGSRTNVSSSHDRYANQEVSYLLQRIEEYDGMVLLASNLKNNIDHAFLRRFQSIVHFPMPKPEERIRLWKKGFQDETKLDADLDLNEVARSYELSGAHINNIIIHCNLLLLGEGIEKINARLLKQSITRELAKEGRTF